MAKLDKIDRKILYELDINARAPVSKIAKRLKTSRDIVNYRINRLEKQGIINGFKTFIDRSKLGYIMYRCYLKFYSISKSEHQSLIKELIENEKVFWVGETDGFIDLSFGVWFEKPIEFYDFYNSIIEKFRKSIKRDYVHQVISYSYLDRSYLLDKKPDKRKEIAIGGNEKQKYKKIDIALLNILSENARTPIIEIASKLKKDSASIIYRIKQLEKKKIILGYNADLDISKLGREFYTVKMYLSDFKRKKEVISYLKSLPFVTNFTKAIGSWDVEVDLEVESSKQYHDFIDDIKEKYEFISEIQFFRAPKRF